MLDGELGAFLRSRREAVTPAEVGLPTGPRRRTPGLRRAELATLAGMSVDYLIRLEQGRDVHPSAQVLAALADALRLGERDRDRLRQLSVISNGAPLCPRARAAARTVRPTVRALLGQLEPAPAYVLNHLSDLLAWTEGYERLAAPLGLLDSEAPNLLRFTFADPRARTAYPDWPAEADAQAAALRAELRDPEGDTAQLAAELAEVAGAEFTDRWQRVDAVARQTGTAELAHPAVGTLRLHHESLELPDPDRQRLVVHLPADTATATALDRLAGRHPGALRAVHPA